MTQVKLSLKNGEWIEDENSDFMLHEGLKRNLDNILFIQKKNFDAVFIIDGKERIGKSTLAMMCGWYLSKGKLTLNNFARGLKDCAKKIQELPDKSVLILDEGSLIFNSKSGMDRDVKALMQLMDVVGQKNLIFIICLPSFFDLNRTIAVRRSQFLVRLVVDDNYNRSNFWFWGEHSKEWLYKKGKKQDNNYNAQAYDWNGKFTEWHTPWYEEYKEIIKKQSLQEALETAMGITQPRNQSELQKAIANAILFITSSGKSYEEAAEILGVGRNQIATWLYRYKNEEEYGDSVNITL